MSMVFCTRAGSIAPSFGCSASSLTFHLACGDVDVYFGMVLVHDFGGGLRIGHGGREAPQCRLGEPPDQIGIVLDDGIEATMPLL